MTKGTVESDFVNRKEAIQRADEELLATLGYKQEFKRAFKPIEVRLPFDARCSALISRDRSLVLHFRLSVSYLRFRLSSSMHCRMEEGLLWSGGSVVFRLLIGNAP